MATITKLEKNLENVVCMIVNLSRPGNTRTIEPDIVETKAEKPLLHLQKTLLDFEELHAVAKHQGKIRRYLYSKCLPSGALGDAVYLFSAARIQEVDDELDKLFGEMQTLVEAAVRVYSDKKVEMRTRLKDLFDEKDYPTVDEFRRAYRARRTIVTLETPSSLEKLDKKFYSEKKGELNKLWGDVMSEVRLGLRAMLYETTVGLVDRLRASDGSGEGRRLKQPAIDKVTKLLEDLTTENVTNDEQLARAADDLRKAMGTLDAQTLRESQDIRAELLNQATKIVSFMEENLEVVSKRKITPRKTEG